MQDDERSTWNSEAMTRANPGRCGAVAVEARAREQQQHHQAAERQVVPGLVPHLAHLLRMPDAPS